MFGSDKLVSGGAGVRWTPLPQAEAPTEPAGETDSTTSTSKKTNLPPST